MNILYVLIPIALVLLGVAVWALFWAIRSGQFDDLDSQGWSVVLDDDTRPPPRAGDNDTENGGERDGRETAPAGRDEP